MSFTRGDLLTKTRKLVKGLAIKEPKWLKAMEEAPQVKFPQSNEKIKKITPPEEVYIKKFLTMHPTSNYRDAARSASISVCQLSPYANTQPHPGLEPSKFSERDREMSFKKGDLMTRRRKLVKGLATKEPKWHKSMDEAPQLLQSNEKTKKYRSPEDVYIKKLLTMYTTLNYQDAVRSSGNDSSPARIFARRVLELKEHGVCEEEATAVAHMEYVSDMKAKKAAYKRLKQLAYLQGKEPPANPFPRTVKQSQAQDDNNVGGRYNPKARDLIRMLVEEKMGTSRQ